MVGNPLPTSWEAGMALEAVQAQAGHASIESARVYLQATSPGTLARLVSQHRVVVDG